MTSSSKKPQLERELNDALKSHADRTGGLMVGDLVRFGDRYAVRITDCTAGAKLEIQLEVPTE